jgi:thiamine-phosphate pyrophosphorylase
MPLQAALRLCVTSAAAVDLGRRPEDVLDTALASGATSVRLALPGVATVGVVSRGAVLAERARDRGILFFVGDDAPAATALGADGMHFSRAGLAPRGAQLTLGAGKVVGVTVSTVLEAVRAAAEGVHYLEVGPVFAGPEPVGLEGLTAICASVDQPVVAAGGMAPLLAADAIRAGAVGIVVGDEVARAEDMEEACLRLRAAVEQALTLRV